MTQVPQTSTDYQSFLKLMTAQMKHQDPLAPMDATKFVTQLAQFSQVEQSVNMNEKLDGLSSMLGSISAQAGTSMIGRSVETANSQVKLTDSTASFRLGLEDTPASSRYIIRDSSGTVVRDQQFTYSGEGQTVSWNGKDQDGNTLDDGFYSVEILATDAEGKSIGGQTYSGHKITEVIQEGGATRLVLETGQELDMTADMRVY